MLVRDLCNFEWDTFPDERMLADESERKLWAPNVNEAYEEPDKVALESWKARYASLPKLV